MAVVIRLAVVADMSQAPRLPAPGMSLSRLALRVLPSPVAKRGPIVALIKAVKKRLLASNP